MNQVVKLLLVGVSTAYLAGCGSSDDASLDADADSVEMPADAALEGITEEPVADPAASMSSQEEAEDEPIADSVEESASSEESTGE